MISPHTNTITLPLLFSKSGHQQTLLLFVVIQITKMFYLLVLGLFYSSLQLLMNKERTGDHETGSVVSSDEELNEQVDLAGYEWRQ